MNSSLSLLVSDEIALEGLDGITLDSLWIRLENRSKFIESETGKTCLPTLTDTLKSKIFEIILFELRKDNVEFYQLKKPREKLKLFGRLENFRIDTATLFYPEDFCKNIYDPVVQVSQNDIRGSCSEFNTRKNCSEDVLRNCKTLDDFTKKYKNLEQMVIVSSQKQRAIALLGQSSWQEYSEMRLESYCILEYVARNRNIGYINSSIEAMNYPEIQRHKAYYYDKNFLVEKGLVQQFFVSYFEPSKARCQGSLLFFTRFKPKYISGVDKNLFACGTLFHEKRTDELNVEDLKQTFISNIHNSSNNPPTILKKKLVNMLDRFPHVFNIVSASNKVRCHLPNFRPAHQSDFYTSNTATNEVTVKDEDDEPEEVLIENPSIREDSLIHQNIQIESKIFKKDFINRIFKIIELYEDRGCTKKQLRRHTGIPMNLIRGTLKNLLDSGLIVQRVHLVNRNNTFMFLAKKYENIEMSEERKFYQEIMGEFVSEQTKKRIEFVLDYVQKKGFFDDMFEFSRSIRAWESERNITTSIGQRTVNGILKKLSQKQLIQVRVFSISWKNIVRNLTIFAHKSYPLDSHMLVDKIDGKLFVVNMIQHVLLKHKFLTFQNHCVEFNELQLSTSQEFDDPVKIEIDESFEAETIDQGDVQKMPPVEWILNKKSFYGKKFNKLECLFTFYRFMHYLLVPQEPSSQDSLEVHNWYQYIPRLYKIFPERSCQLLDVMLYMPVHMIRSLSNIQHDGPELYEYWNDPVKKYFTLHRVPSSVRMFLIHNRRAHFKLTEFLGMGSLMGLFTVHRNRQIQSAESLLFTLNKEIHLPGPLFEYGPIDYRFETIHDFNRFAQDIETHLINDGCGESSTEKCSVFPDIKIHSTNFLVNRTSKRALEDIAEIRAKRIRMEKAKKKKTEGDTKKSKAKKGKTKDIASDDKNAKDKKLKKPKKDTGRQRRQPWSRGEDQFLLQCRLVSLIMEPNCPHQTNVSRVLLMKLLHEHFPYSIGKEQNSIAKRMTKLIQISSIKKTLAFALKELDFIDPDSFVSQETTAELVRDDKFVQILKVVREYKFKHTDFFLSNEEKENRKFSKNCFIEFDMLPNTIEDLRNNFTILTMNPEKKDTFFKEPNNFIDIHGYVIANILLSALISSTWKVDETEILKNSFFRSMKRALKYFPESVITVVFRRLFTLGMIRKIRTKQRNLRFPWLNYRLSTAYFDKLQQYYIPYSITQANDPIVVENNNSAFSVWQFAETLSSNVLGLSEDYELKFNTEIPDEFFQFNSKSNGNRETSFRSLISRQFESNTKNSDEFTKEGKELNDFLVKHIKVKIDKTLINDRIDDDSHFQVINELKRRTKIYSAKKIQGYSQSEFDESIQNVGTLLPERFVDMIIKKLERSTDLGVKESVIMDLIKSEPDITKNMIESFFRVCEDLELIFEVGIYERTWVHRKFYHHWLMHHRVLPSPGDNVDNCSANESRKLFVFLPKLWRLSDGKIDHNSLFAFFNLILGHLTFEHASSFVEMREQFTDILPGAQLLELLHYLTILGCVKKIRVPVRSSQRQGKNCNSKIESFCDYFNQEYDLSDEDEDEELDDSFSEQSSCIDLNYDTFYEASLNSTTKLASFFQTFQRENFT